KGIDIGPRRVIADNAAVSSSSAKSAAGNVEVSVRSKEDQDRLQQPAAAGGDEIAKEIARSRIIALNAIRVVTANQQVRANTRRCWGKRQCENERDDQLESFHGILCSKGLLVRVAAQLLSLLCDMG